MGARLSSGGGNGGGVQSSPAGRPKPYTGYMITSNAAPGVSPSSGSSSGEGTRWSTTGQSSPNTAILVGYQGPVAPTNRSLGNAPVSPRRPAPPPPSTMPPSHGAAPTSTHLPPLPTHHPVRTSTSQVVQNYPTITTTQPVSSVANLFPLREGSERTVSLGDEGGVTASGPSDSPVPVSATDFRDGGGGLLGAAGAFAFSSQFALFTDLRCSVCHKTISSDSIELHLLSCLTKPQLIYNEDVLLTDKGECSICFDELQKGNRIARLPCLCIYHKGCIDDWFTVSRCCPEHPDS